MRLVEKKRLLQLSWIAWVIFRLLLHPKEAQRIAKRTEDYTIPYFRKHSWTWSILSHHSVFVVCTELCSCQQFSNGFELSAITCDYIDWITTKYRTGHDNRAVVVCAIFRYDSTASIWVITNWFLRNTPAFHYFCPRSWSHLFWQILVTWFNCYGVAWIFLGVIQE